MKREKHTPALLVVDMQGFFLDPDSPAFMPSAKAILPRVRALAKAFHRAGRPIAYAVYRTPKTGPMTKRWHKVCRGQAALALPATFPAGKRFIKGCYSAFRGTSLLRWLKSRKVKKLVICGIKTHLCVESTVRDAFDLGFEVVVPAKACASGRPALHRGSLASMAAGFARIC